MALRKRKKHAGEVNMSSMTDIIFMLLIFFMLTSTLVKFVPFKLPESDQRSNGGSLHTTINLHKSGKIEVNGMEVTIITLEQVLKAAINISPDKEKPVVAVAAEMGAEVGKLTKILAVTNRLKARTILATDPRE
jgi:biopolymer transport protein ExbD